MITWCERTPYDWSSQGVSWFAVLTVFLAFTSITLGQDRPASAAEAVSAYKKAIESGDVQALGELTSGKPGEILRALAEPLAKARAASNGFEEALRDKAIPLNNPFAASVTPLADWQFELVEPPTKSGDRVVLLARVGARGRVQEEALAVTDAEGPWRVSAPSDLARTLKPLTQPAALEQHLLALTRLTEVLTKAREDVEAGRYRTRDTVLLRLAQLVVETKLADASR